MASTSVTASHFMHVFLNYPKALVRLQLTDVLVMYCNKLSVNNCECIGSVNTYLMAYSPGQLE